jgi:hypothetical protein
MNAGTLKTEIAVSSETLVSTKIRCVISEVRNQQLSSLCIVVQVCALWHKCTGHCKGVALVNCDVEPHGIDSIEYIKDETIQGVSEIRAGSYDYLS